MTETAINDIIRHDEIGKQMFEDFVIDCLTERKLTVWNKISKKKPRTFKSVNALSEIRIRDKLVKIKEERGLLQSFIVISRSRPELDLKECIVTYDWCGASIPVCLRWIPTAGI